MSQPLQPLFKQRRGSAARMHLALLPLSLLLLLVAGAHASVPGPTSPSGAALSTAAAPTIAPAEPLLAPPWWTGFADTVLDALLTRLSADPALNDAELRELQARIATLYVQMRALSLSGRLLNDRRQLLSNEASAWTASGPTPRAANAVDRLQTEVAATDQRIDAIDRRLLTLKTVLVRLDGGHAPLPEGLDAQLMLPAPPAFTPQPGSAMLALQWAPAALREQLGRDEQTLQQAVMRWKQSRQALGQLQLERRTGLGDDSAVAQGMAVLMQNVQELTDAAAAQAVSWIRIYASAPDGAR